jgi:hypothetical protein
MRKKILKYLSVFSLWFAVLTLCSHSLMPHDHHTDETFPTHEEDCPASNNNSRHHNGFPVHCHAFNDLTSERLRPIHILQNIQDTSFTFHNFSYSAAIDLQVFYTGIFEIHKPVLDSFILDLSLLRAPPVSA